jgi:hypothetical protein
MELKTHIYDVYYTGNNTLGADDNMIEAFTGKEAAILYLNKNKINFSKLKYGFVEVAEHQLICVTKCQKINNRIYIAGKRTWYQVFKGAK